MANDVFLVAAGGTGMRCLQSVVNMAAMGLFPGKTVNILLLETDEENKDKRNTENLLSWYRQIQKSKSTKDETSFSPLTFKAIGGSFKEILKSFKEAFSNKPFTNWAQHHWVYTQRKDFDMEWMHQQIQIHHFDQHSQPLM